jgi:predicted nucleic acid-binding protein
LYLAVRGKAGAPPRLTEEGAAERWQLFHDLRIELMAIDDIGGRIISLAHVLKRPSVYDVTYAVVAERLGAIMVTGDERFVNAARSHLPCVRPVWEVTSRALRGKSAT